MPWPMRLAGTASVYSKSAMPQLISTTCQSAQSLCFKCQYQAMVMRTFDAESSSTVAMDGSPEWRSKCRRRAWLRKEDRHELSACVVSGSCYQRRHGLAALAHLLRPRAADAGRA